MNMLKKNILILTATLLLLPVLAWAKPVVTMAITAEKDILVEEDGKEVTKRVPAEEITPGDIVIYTINYKNSGDEAATGVKIVDPIPEGTAYIPGSATQTGELTFSIDNGKTYQPPTLLSYEITTADGKKEKRIASPEEYTNIRWVISAIAAGDTGTLSFQVRTK